MIKYIWRSWRWLCIVATITVASGLTLTAQDHINAAQDHINAVLSDIEANNGSLKALRETAEAEKLANKTGITPTNPEVEFNYLWGSPLAIGNRMDFSVKQTFDIAFLTGRRKHVAVAKNELVELRYKAERLNIMLEAKSLCLELIYLNGLRREQVQRLQQAQILADAYRIRMDKGDVNRLEYNKVCLALTTAQSELARTDVERNTHLSTLRQLNGGNSILFEADSYGETTLPPDFDTWLEEEALKNPYIAYARQSIELEKQQVSLSKATGWPSFSAGYMSEKVVGQQYQGLTLGLSIPLWENKNRLKQAKAAVVAAEANEADSRSRFYCRLQTVYERARSLKSIAEQYRSSLANVNNADLLKKARDTGEISLLEYIVELNFYYDALKESLAAERDYQLSIAELFAYEL